MKFRLMFDEDEKVYVLVDENGREKHVANARDIKQGFIEWEGQKFPLPNREREQQILEEIQKKSPTTVNLGETKAYQQAKARITEGEVKKGPLSTKETIERFTGPLEVTLPAIAGSMVNPAVGAANTMIMTLVNSLSKEGGSAQTPEQMRDIVGTALANAGLQGGIDLLAGKLPIRKPITRMATLFGEKLEPPLIEFLNKYPKFKASAGQLRNSWVGSLAESTLLHHLKQKMTAAQQKFFSRITKRYTRDLGSDAMANMIKEEIVEGMNAQRIKASDFWEAAKSEAAQNIQPHITTTPVTTTTARATSGRFAGIPVPTTTGGQSVTKMIPGPIEIGRVKQAAAAMKAKLGENVPQDMAHVASRLDQIIAMDDVIPFQEAIGLKSEMGSRGFRGFLKTKDEGAFTRLYGAFDESITDSLANPAFNYPNMGANIINNYSQGNAETRVLHEVFEDFPEINKIVNTSKSGKMQVQGILADANQLEATLKHARDPEATRLLLKEQFLNRTFRAGGSVKGEFKPGVMSGIFENPDNEHIVRQLFTDPAEKRELSNFFKAVDYFNPKVKEAGVTTLALHAWGAGLGATTGIAVALGKGEDLKKGGAIGAGAGLFALLSIRGLAKNVLLNPEGARLATNLAHADPSSLKAKALRKTLFQMMKYSTVNLMTKDGKIIGNVYINGDGKLVPIKPGDEPLPEPDQE